MPGVRNVFDGVRFYCLGHCLRQKSMVARDRWRVEVASVNMCVEDRMGFMKLIESPHNICIWLIALSA